MPLPYVAKVAHRDGRSLDSVEADWARALSIITAEYGDIPASRRYALATKVFKNIAKRAKNEMTMSGTTGGFVASTATVVVAGTRTAVDPRRGKGRAKKVQEDLALGNVVSVLPDQEQVLVQDGAGYEAPDNGDPPEQSNWQEAGYRAAGSQIRGAPVGIVAIMGKKHIVYRDAPAKRLRAVPLFRESADAPYFCPRCQALEAAAKGLPAPAEEDRTREIGIRFCRGCTTIATRYAQPGLHESALNERARQGYICPKCESKDTYARSAHEDTSMECTEYRCRACKYSVESDDKTNPAFRVYEFDDGEPESDWTQHLHRLLTRRGEPRLSEAVAYSPQAIAIALKGMGVPLARGERHEASGVEVVKVGEEVGWRWSDHAGRGDRHSGTVQVLACLDGLGFRTYERVVGSGFWVIVPQDTAPAVPEAVAPRLARQINETAAAVRRLR